MGKLVNVYPNPNTGKFTIEANLPATERVRISVTNLLGQEVEVISYGALNQNTFQVDLFDQKAGVYMLTVKTANQIFTKRIVVTK
ncbi:MAG: T9SS type A sorting domain-containing protein [Bacteroidia bacterium]